MGVGIAIETETAPIGFAGSRSSAPENLSVNEQLSERANGSGSDLDVVVMCTVIRHITEIAAGIMEAVTAAVTAAATTTAKCSGAIATDWIEVKRTLAIAGLSIRITRATIDRAIPHTAMVSAEGTKSVIASTTAAADSNGLQSELN
jgi:hypothetical protein